CRILAATNRNLRQEVQRGAFRDDLYFRLSVVTVEVPPLRQRPEDVPVLAQRLLAELAKGVPVPAIADETLAAVRGYDWPGHIRELRNVLERAYHLSQSMGCDPLKLVGFPPQPDRDDEIGAGGLPRFEEGLTYREMRARFEARFERDFVTWLLERHGGNV